MEIRCNWCGSKRLKTIFHAPIKRGGFKAQYRCVDCGKTFTVKGCDIKRPVDNVKRFSVLVDGMELRNICKYYFTENGKGMCARNSTIVECEFQCRR